MIISDCLSLVWWPILHLSAQYQRFGAYLLTVCSSKHFKVIFLTRSQGSRGPGGKGPGPLKIQWGPCEILPQGPMAPRNLRIGNVFNHVNGGTLQIFLGALGNSNGGGPRSSTKNVYQEPWEDILIILFYWQLLFVGSDMPNRLAFTWDWTNVDYSLVRKVPWHSPKSNLTASVQGTILDNEFENHTFKSTTYPRGQLIYLPVFVVVDLPIY